MKLAKNPLMEQQFSQIYNRDVTVMNGKEMNEDGTVKKAVAEITTDSGETYTLTEYMKDNGTDFVLLDYKGKQHRYRTYLEAEYNMAYQIGGEI